MKRIIRDWAWVGITLMVMFCAVIVVARHSTWRSDAALKRHFLEHRTEFEKLVVMANQDVHLTRIAPDFTWLDDSGAWPRKNAGISEERWNEYRELFRSVGASAGINKDADNSRIFFSIVLSGIAPASVEKGLVYSAKPPSPILNSLDEEPPKQYWEKSHVLVYKPIEGHWYIFYEES